MRSALAVALILLLIGLLAGTAHQVTGCAPALGAVTLGAVLAAGREPIGGRS